VNSTLELVHQERLGLVQRFREVPTESWDAPSLCRGWSIRNVLAHLVTPFLVSPGRVFVRVAQTGGLSKAMDSLAKDLGDREPAEMIGVLEGSAGSSFRPPGMPVAAPLTDAVVHGADVRWALGDRQRDWGDVARMVPVLDFLVSTRAHAGFVPLRRLQGLRLVADDQDWSHGTGLEVVGPSLPLAMAVLGRSAALPHLSGSGVGQLMS
jgi:uncharacterized protein (TIGR03083 family)